MSRHAAWLPNVTPLIAGARPLEIDPTTWERIEAAFGAALDQSSRDALAEIAGRYMALRQIELDPPLASDAFAHVVAVEKAASALKAALQPLLHGGDGVAHRVGRLFNYSLAEIYRRSLRDGLLDAPESLCALSYIEPAPELLLLAAAGVREKLTREGPIRDLDGKLYREIETKAPTYAFDWLIGELEAFVNDRGRRVASRKDYADEVSRFIKFVFELQKALPKTYRCHTSSEGALSAYVAAARRKRNFGTD